jgi:amidase
MAPSFDTAGWFARDLDVFLKVGLVLLDGGSTAAEVEHVRLAEFAFDVADNEITVPLQNWMNSDQCNLFFENPVRELPGGISLDDAREAFRIIQAREIWQTFGSWIDQNAPTFGPGVKERLEIAKTVTAEEWETQILYKEKVATALREIVPPGTVMTLPATASLPVEVNTDPDLLNAYRVKTLNLICLAGLAGLPQISIPVTNSNGIPVSLGLIGWEGGDEALLSMVSHIGITGR